jgi:hypothetical protein
MRNSQRTMGALVLAAAAGLAGCGGGGDSGTPAPAPDPNQSVAGLVAYLQALIAGTDDTSEPLNIDAVSPAVDDTADPVTL